MRDDCTERSESALRYRTPTSAGFNERVRANQLMRLAVIGDQAGSVPLEHRI
jgi:hypothetical protein